MGLFVEEKVVFVHRGRYNNNKVNIVCLTMQSLGMKTATFLKRGCPRSNNTTAGERYSSGPLREQPLAGTMEQWRIENTQITADLRDTNGAVKAVDLIA